MKPSLCLWFHAHLPFVRHPEHELFLEESWLFEAITECYVPFLQMLDSWWRDGLDSRVTFTLTPTLCSMLRDPLLMERYTARLRELITLAEQECIRTTLQPQFQAIAEFYFQRLSQVLEYFEHEHGDLVNPFKRCQDRGNA